MMARPAMKIGTERKVMHRANILAEQQVQCPLEGNANLFVKPRQFAQINCAPKPPRKETREVEAENPCNAVTAADGGEQSNGLEGKWLWRLAGERQRDILRHHPALANGVLRGGRMSPFWVIYVGHKCTIADRPDPGPSGELQELVYH